MGIGRRSFIKLSSLALMGTITDPLQAVVTHENFYVNKKLGIMFEIPEKWGFVKVKDFGKLKSEQILDGIYELIKDDVYEDLGEPICIATKYYQDLPQYKGMFSPTITLNVTPKSELKDLGFKNFEELIEISSLGTSHLLKEFNIVKRHETYNQSGCKFYENDSTYKFEHVELKKPLNVELKTIKFENNNFYYDLNCHQSNEVNQIAVEEFEFFKQSIKLI